MEELGSMPPGELQRLIGRLTVYADRKMVKLTWRGVPARSGGKPPGGIDPQDVAADAINRFARGERNWNREKHETVEHFLESVIDSIVFHLVKSIENRQTRYRIPSPESGDDVEAAEYLVETSDPFPVDLAANRELADKFRQAVFREVGADKLVEVILDCAEADIAKASEIAEFAGVNVEEIYKARTRLNRAVTKIRNKQERT